jgi:hypothetical protein
VNNLPATTSTDELLHDEDPFSGGQSNLRAEQLLDWVEQYYNIHGVVPTVQVAQDLGLDTELFKRWIRSKPFRKHLKDRGVALASERHGSDIGVEALSPQQFAALKVMTDLTDNRSIKRKLSDLEISSQTWLEWTMDPVFGSYLNEFSERVLKSSQYEAHLALVDNVRAGDMTAIKYFNEITGRFSAANATSAMINPGELIQNIVEILQEEIKDTDTLTTIGKRMMGMVARVQAEALNKN